MKRNFATKIESSREPPKAVSRMRGNPAERQLAALLQTFNTWAFKREHPSDLPLLRRFAARAVIRGQKLSFVLYWGKGPRNAVASPDIQCLDYLGSLVSRIKTQHREGTEINLVLTDTHARLNGHSDENISDYFSQVANEASARGFVAFRLSDVVAAADGHGGAARPETPSSEVLQRLVCSAEKWYRGDGDSLTGATKYFQMNMIERQAIEVVFCDSIFVSFNGSEQRDLFPQNLPIFYMYSLRRGTSVKPWFLSGLPDATDATTPSTRLPAG